MLPSDSLCGKVSDLLKTLHRTTWREVHMVSPAAASQRNAPHKGLEESPGPCQIPMSPRVFVECLESMSLGRLLY